MSASLLRTVDRQGGVFTREQALGAVPPARLRSNLRRGVWRRTPWAGVYVDGELPDDVAATVRAAALWLGGDLVACHTTAAHLWGFDLRPADRARAEPLHFMGPERINNRRVRGLQVHASCLGADDVVRHRGVWVTGPARTACDVARLGAPVDALATLDAALRSGTCTRDGLTTATAAQAGLRDVVRLRELVPHADAGAESPMESRMRWRFLAAGLAAPRLQVEVVDGGRRHRLDVGWEDHRVAAEFDGLEAHMTRRQLAADRIRHNWLTERDWRLLHVTAVDVHQRYERMVTTVRRHLSARAPTIMQP
ncbi:very-short-patch-repair endonuclease [Geodermatophilus bullaregiensis]|uniref:hypothetical protein n=1 Tax=Geodermatophilus bullaregiensis TaxID=1564160 RepID=UPI0019591788|nr:hypothetical protein [Geodermatophilus bullaregiensis]MBM7805844.1 very-short-patch-repair endonuclease [Geodermatophilus bullaregiensis]